MTLDTTKPLMLRGHPHTEIKLIGKTSWGMLVLEATETGETFQRYADGSSYIQDQDDVVNRPPVMVPKFGIYRVDTMYSAPPHLLMTPFDTHAEAQAWIDGHDNPRYFGRVIGFHVPEYPV